MPSSGKAVADSGSVHLSRIFGFAECRWTSLFGDLLHTLFCRDFGKSSRVCESRLGFPVGRSCSGGY
jgi:hypothetical protein